MADPSLEARPEFHSNAYTIIRQALMATHNKNEQQAIEHLIATWDTEHQEWIDVWTAQQAAESHEAQCIKQEHQELEEEEQRIANEEAEREKTEADKKKPKMSGFNESLPPPSVLIPRPSQFALQRINAFDFVELWYFSPKGCKDTARTPKSQMDDALGLTSSNNVLTLRPIASIKASSNARLDSDLSFSEFL